MCCLRHVPAEDRLLRRTRSGCREVVDDGVNGYMIPQKNSKELVAAIEKFLKLNYIEKRQMGLNARDKVEKQFDRQIVVRAYMEKISSI